MWIFNAIANAVGKNFIGTPNYLFGLLFNRVKADGGVTEAQQCTIEELTDLQNDNLLSSASLVVTPSSYKEGKLYSVVPSDGSGDLSVARATTATRVNSAGLVELVPYNILEYSEQFDNVYWGKNSVTITANATSSPNGTLTAEKVIGDATTSAHEITRILTRTSGNYTATTSIYAKQSEDKYVLLQFSDITGGIAITFDVNLGIVSAAAATYGTGWAEVSNSITSVGNGWFRIAFTATTINASTSLTASYRVGNIPNLFGGSTGNGVNGVYIWGAQVNEGTLKNYQRTETRLNIPRLDYSLGSCPSLLVEPQRTNLALWSEQFDNASWLKLNGSVTANSVISPDGLQDADSFVENTATGLHIIYTAFTSVSSTTYTVSTYIKPNTRTQFYLRTDLSSGTARTLFDLTGAGSVVTLAHSSATIVLVSDGWYRATITFTEGTGGSRLFAIEGSTPSGVSYTGNGLTAFYLYGAQLESGSYATSYIPTTSASVTRNADVISKTGISSLIGQTEGTIFFEGNVLNLSQARRFIVLYQDANNYMTLRVTGGNDLQFLIVSGGATSVNITTANIQGNIKMALAYKNNDFVAYLNGTQVGSDTSGSVPTTSDFYLGCDQSGINQMAGGIKVSALWKTRLSNDQLELLTGDSFYTYAEMASYYNYTLQ